jgi:hypothetical protein
LKAGLVVSNPPCAKGAVALIPEDGIASTNGSNSEGGVVPAELSNLGDTGGEKVRGWLASLKVVAATCCRIFPRPIGEPLDGGTSYTELEAGGAAGIEDGMPAADAWLGTIHWCKFSSHTGSAASILAIWCFL